MKRSIPLIALLSLVIGTSTVLASEKISPQEKPPSSQSSKDVGQNVEEMNQNDTTEDISSSSQTKGEKRIVKRNLALQFNEKALENKFYVEVKESTGKVNYKLATNELLEDLEARAGGTKLSSYNVEYKGQLITVLALP